MKYKRFIICGLITLLPSCSQHSIRLKNDLIQPYSYSEQAKEVNIAPYVAKYEKNGKFVWYIAVTHGSEINGSTFKTIKDVFNSFHPGAVLIEGVVFNGNYSPESYKRRAIQCATIQFQGCSESSYAAYLAINSKTPFIPSEIQDLKIDEALTAQGYQENESKLLMAGQLILQYSRQQPKKLKDLDGQLKKDAGVSLKQFESWYQEKSNRVFEIREINNETFSPQTDRKPTYFNKLAAAQGLIREEFIMQRIQEAVGRFDRLLVVFGSAHLIKDRKALNDAFGSSNDVKLYPSRSD